jgi:sterol desaturase/sphingolipid hydroxylase (fatty acid hydroxylase superfamily)
VAVSALSDYAAWTTLVTAFAQVHAWLFEGVVEPLLHQFGLDNWLELAFDGVEFFLFGVLEVLALGLLVRPLEFWWPAEHWPTRQGVGTDLIYTLLHRLGLVPLLFFLVLQPVADAVDAALRLRGYIPLTLESVLPGLLDRPVLTFAAYLLLLDLAAYWQHRLQHRLDWWWALHALHHSQQRMSLWTDDRNHLLDDVIGALWFAFIALLIGVPPGQFLFLALLTRVLQSLAHANLRLSFGALGDRLLVSPHFHRIHHAVEIGHQGTARGCNFAVLFPMWDVLFGTARFGVALAPTGIADQAEGHDYGRGIWDQQWRGLQRLASVVWPGRQRTSA